MKTFKKKAPRNGNESKSNLNQMEQKNEILKSFCPDLSDLEIQTYVNINSIFMKQQNFTMSNLQMAGLIDNSVFS